MIFLYCQAVVVGWSYDNKNKNVLNIFTLAPKGERGENYKSPPKRAFAIDTENSIVSTG
jgi:hypothetical protein